MIDKQDNLTINGNHKKTVTLKMPNFVKGTMNFYAQNIKSGTFTAYDFGIYAGDTLPDNLAQYNGVAVPLSFPSTIYGGSLDAVTGEGKETWKLVTLDGTEAWNTWGIGFKYPDRTGFYSYSVNDYDVATVAKAISSHYRCSLNTFGGGELGFGLADGGTSRYVIFSVRNEILDISSDEAALKSFKAYLAAQYAAGTPVQIAYKLETPEPFTATGAQPIPALPGVNTVLTDADSATVTGRADPIKRITDLEDAVASMTTT